MKNHWNILVLATAGLTAGALADDQARHLETKWVANSNQTEKFLEVAGPLPGQLVEQEAERFAMEVPSFERDRSQRLVRHEPPSVVRLSQADFLLDNNQSRAEGPHLLLSFRERVENNLIHQYEVSRQIRLPGQGETVVRDFNTLREWAWVSEDHVYPRTRINITITGLPEGSLSYMEGFTDERGELRVPLILIRDAVLASNQEEVEIRFWAAYHNRTLRVVLNRDIFERQLMANLPASRRSGAP